MHLEEDVSKIPDVSIVENSAELLFGLVHQRFILTKAGLSSMVSRASSQRWIMARHVTEAICNTTSVGHMENTELTLTVGQVRTGSLRRMSPGVLPCDTRLALWPCGYAGSGHSEAVLSQLRGYIYTAEQQVYGNRR